MSPRRPHTAAEQPPAISPAGRLLVPVLGTSGGCGRSTTAGLIASALAATAPSVILDTTPRLGSPWPTWSEPTTGLAALPHDQPLTRRQVMAAVAPGPASAGEPWQVLTDHQDWNRAPLDLPVDPAAWYQLAAVGGWQVVIADTSYAVAYDIITARWQNHPSTTATWCALPYAVPVLCAVANGPGVDALHTTVQALLAADLPLQRIVVALVASSSGRRPSAVRAAVTMLKRRVAAVVEVPYESRISARGLHAADQLGGRTVSAAAELARDVLAAAHRTWGTPLPPAPPPIGLLSAVPRSVLPEGVPVP